MIPKEILRQVRRIEIQTTRLVNDLFGGEYRSVFKGRGIEFADVREYVPGDDIRTIDWNVTARSQHPFVKKFVEERELTVVFVVDMSGSQYFGTAGKFKSEIAAEITALLAFAAVRNKDKVGLLIASDQVEKYVPVKKGRTHVLRVVREILYFQPKHRGTNLEVALEYVNRVLTRRAVVFVISDFMDQGYEKALRLMNRRHDLIAIQLTDSRERLVPRAGLVEMEDPETGERIVVDTSDGNFARRYEAFAWKRDEDLGRLFKSLKIDRVSIDISQSYAEPLIRFFRLRERRL
jgi:uncharacterized protein (DUF58 family)